jgi:RIO-like serine/threonine protein kinase
MNEESKIHCLKSKITSLKEAVELLKQCSQEKKHSRLELMRKTAEDVVKILTELESELPKN